jgi:hypothetical protein
MYSRTRELLYSIVEKIDVKSSFALLSGITRSNFAIYFCMSNHCYGYSVAMKHNHALISLLISLEVLHVLMRVMVS